MLRCYLIFFFQPFRHYIDLQDVESEVSFHSHVCALTDTPPCSTRVRAHAHTERAHTCTRNTHVASTAQATPRLLPDILGTLVFMLPFVL